MKTLTLAPQIKTFFKPVRTQGDLVTFACFVVAQYADGRMQILKTFYKTVKTEVASAVEGVVNTVLTLAGPVVRLTYTIVRSFFERKVAYTYSDLSFVISQPTRAPSF